MDSAHNVRFTENPNIEQLVLAVSAHVCSKMPPRKIRDPQRPVPSQTSVFKRTSRAVCSVAGNTKIMKKNNYLLSRHYGALVLGNFHWRGYLDTHSDNSRARVYCACSKCGWGLFERLWEAAR